jgi:mannose-6-phosphate isomerase-like protein (cupin superfamily)
MGESPTNSQEGTMSTTGLEIWTHSETGFKPLISFGHWRVAVNNAPAGYQQKTITRLSAHCETDEVFVLIKGSGALIIGGNGEVPTAPEIVWMQPGLLYNVTRGTWHSNAFMPGAQVVIVENADTSGDNSKDHDLESPVVI